MAQAPRTRYAKCGDMDIAYQVLGDGPDLLVLPGPMISIDSIDSEPSLYRFHRRLASFARVIRFDQRGIGLSSRIPTDGAMSPEYWAQDAIAVMDAVGSLKATLLGFGFTVMTGLALAADYPERVRSIVIVNGAARVMRAPDYEAGYELRAVEPARTVMTDPDALEHGFDLLELIAPSMARDDAFRAWWDVAGNRAASPSMARAVSEVLTAADERDKLARISAPTLILHRDECSFVPVGHGRYLAEHIAGSRYVELPGSDALHWVGDSGPILNEIEEFVTGVRGFAAERVLTTILFTDIVGSTRHAAELGDLRWRDLLDNHDRIVRLELGRFRGREVNTAGDGFVATFTSPSLALECAEALAEAVRPLGIEIRAGVHAGEVEMRGADIAGMAVHIAARVAALAGPGEVLVSSTVREIVTGSGQLFTERGEHDLKGVPGRWRVYASAPS